MLCQVVLSNRHILAGRDFHYLLIALTPDGKRRGIEDAGAIYGEYKPFISLHIVVYFNIGGVPNIILIGHQSQKIFNYIPIIINVKLEAVSPKIE